MGPVSAKSYPGRGLVRPRPPPAGRARQEIDHGRRGKGYVFGAFCPATGAALAAGEDRLMQHRLARHVGGGAKVGQWSGATAALRPE
jgi:hypothetical protein